MKSHHRELFSEMAQTDGLAFNIGAFISTLFLLEFGADKFITHTAAVASRIGVSEVIIGLLTAGAEWEEVQLNIALVLSAMKTDFTSLLSSSRLWRRAVLHWRWEP